MNKVICFLFLFILSYLSYKKQIYNEGFKILNKKSYKYGIVMCCFNRPEYLSKTLNSLKKSRLNNCLICIVDDCSNNINTIKLIKDFRIDSKNCNIIKIRNKTNLGIQKSLLKGFEKINKYDCKYLTNIDSDVIMKPDWLNTFDKTYQSVNSKINNNGIIITGFNCVNSCKHKVVKTYDDFHIKGTIGGINMFFDKNVYKTIFKPVLQDNTIRKQGWDWSVCRKMAKKGRYFVATKPSVIQHIGINGMWSKTNRVDIAEDY